MATTGGGGAKRGGDGLSLAVPQVRGREVHATAALGGMVVWLICEVDIREGIFLPHLLYQLSLFHSDCCLRLWRHWLRGQYRRHVRPASR